MVADLNSALIYIFSFLSLQYFVFRLQFWKILTDLKNFLLGVDKKNAQICVMAAERLWKCVFRGSVSVTEYAIPFPPDLDKGSEL